MKLALSREEAPFEAELVVPDSWATAEGPNGEVIAFPRDIESRGSRFLPNVLIELVRLQADDEPRDVDDGYLVLSSSRSAADGDLVESKVVLGIGPEETSVLQQIYLYTRLSCRLSVICSADSGEWATLGSDFDHLIERVLIRDSEQDTEEVDP